MKPVYAAVREIAFVGATLTLVGWLLFAIITCPHSQAGLAAATSEPWFMLYPYSENPWAGAWAYVGDQASTLPGVEAQVDPAQVADHSEWMGACGWNERNAKAKLTS
jgi:hypothetical protein